MTAYFLLTWNPRRGEEEWPHMHACVKASRRGRQVPLTWRCYNRSPTGGDRVFLLRQGVKPRGIMGSGVVLREAYREDLESPRKVAVLMDVLLDPAREGVLPISELRSDGFADVHWGTQRSGIVLSERAAGELQKRWEVFVVGSKRRLVQTGIGSPFPDELPAIDLVEGAKQEVIVNRYERNSAARQLCIEHYGPRCVVCDLDFEEQYGESMAGFIHVHHLSELSAIGKSYRVDPIKHLRPICPNCHAVVHSRRPAMTIEQARALIAAAARR